MRPSNLLYKTNVAINEYIHIAIPTVGEVLDHENLYYGLVSMLTSVPADTEMMVLLDDNGIDYTEIDDYGLFLLLWRDIAHSDARMIFGDTDLRGFEIAINEENGTLALVNRDTGAVIDRAIYEDISDTLRQIHHLKKNIRKPANKEAKEYLLERARKKLRRRKKDRQSPLEELIIALVNTEQFSYTYSSVRDMTIYQFNESLRQIAHKIDYDNRMRGVYAGTVSVKDLSQDDLNWLKHK